MWSRRGFAKVLSSAGAAAMIRVPAWGEAEPEYRIEIGPVELEVSRRRTIRTTGYNGQVPGPLLRFHEGRPVTIEVTNKSEHPEVVHWHGLFLPPEVDGAAEEGTPMITPGGSTRMTFTPSPSGFRWYHTHTMAMNDLSRAQYGGQHGFLYVEPRVNAGRYDAEFFVALHDWRGVLVGTDDATMSPKYDVSTVNGKTLGFGEPLRVKQGQRVMLHVLNSSPSEVHWVALTGHSMKVVALDGNPVPTQKKVAMLRLAPAERACVVVEMNSPGVWVLGEVRKEIHAAGMGVVVEYTGQGGEPKWQEAGELLWDYAWFAAAKDGVEAAGMEEVTEIPLVIESKFHGHGAMESWTINGSSYPKTSVAPLKLGQRYRLQFINRSGDDHPMHLHRHVFELRELETPLKGKAGVASPGNGVRGVMKDTVLVRAQTVTSVEFTANNPGDTLLHCHQQNHMDLGFMMLLRYG